MSNPTDFKKLVTDHRNNFFKKSSDIFNAFSYSINYSNVYNSLVSNLSSDTSMKIYGQSIPKGIAIFSFGAPARNEMMGRSDADIAVYRSNNSGKAPRFRENLIESLQGFGFTKVDTPMWGSLDDIQRYMVTSVTEANQIIEAQFICGDTRLRDKIEQLRTSLYDEDIIARNLVFQFFYFEQYFRKKKFSDHLNLKYCSGGTRDFLFPMWYAHLKQGIEKDLQITAMERGLNALYDDGLLSREDVTTILESSSAISFIRDEIMGVTPKDIDGKLSTQKATEVYKQNPHIFERPQNIVKIVEESRPKIEYAKTKVWEGLCNYFSETKSETWNKYFKKTLSKNISEELPSELQDDEIINTIKIWNLDAQNTEQSPGYLEKISHNNSWIILASLLSNPHIPGKIIDSVIRRRGLIPGYEYFLEIAARNPNLQKETLEFIIKDDSTEPRFKKPAQKLAKELGLW